MDYVLLMGGAVIALPIAFLVLGLLSWDDWHGPLPR